MTVKTLIILYGIWYVAPFALVTYFAGMQTLSQDQIEAASIDGATRWQKIRHIVIPHVRSLTILILLISIMDAYRVFDSVFVFSEMNPIYKADTVMTYTFQTAITVQRLGKANAMAILTVIGIMVVLIPNLIQSYRQQIEERNHGKTKSPIGRFLIHVALILFSIYSLVPFFWTILQSFKKLKDANSRTPKFIFTPTWENYQELWLRSVPENGATIAYFLMRGGRHPGLSAAVCPIYPRPQQRDLCLCGAGFCDAAVGDSAAG